MSGKSVKHLFFHFLIFNSFILGNFVLCFEVDPFLCFVLNIEKAVHQKMERNVLLKASYTIFSKAFEQLLASNSKYLIVLPAECIWLAMKHWHSENYYLGRRGPIKLKWIFSITVMAVVNMILLISPRGGIHKHPPSPPFSSVFFKHICVI